MKYLAQSSRNVQNKTAQPQKCNDSGVMSLLPWLLVGVSSEWCQFEHEAVVADADGFLESKVRQRGTVAGAPAAEYLWREDDNIYIDCNHTHRQVCRQHPITYDASINLIYQFTIIIILRNVCIFFFIIIII